ncbi:hypothetical protein B0H14DRAFT_2907992 [Mycena olivaceomarginata]|nr:hypothetical protein B0H14DRAFT_2907992 [Mycena olivaceomarginata]
MTLGPGGSSVEDPALNSLDGSASNDSDEDLIPPNPNHTDSATGSLARLDSTALCILHLTSHGHRFGPLRSPPSPPGGSVPPVLQYDIRSLPNPPKNVRAQQTGLNKSLREWFFSRPESVAKLDEVCAAIDAALDEVAKSGVGHSELHVVVFCEMGKHRSVALVEELSRRAFFVGTENGRKKCPVVVQHRDVARGKHDARRKQNPADSSQE